MRTCPECHSAPLKLRVRRVFDENTGKSKFAGEYYSCRCPDVKLTYSPDSGTYNFRE